MKIASSYVSAENANKVLNSVVIGDGSQVHINKSTVTSMKNGEKVANNLIPALSELVDCVKTQGDKFPQIALELAKVDNQIEFD